ncbi:hypothetical protein EJ04DRAFT_484747 [Polyplosphaeria fusca]|uniref:Glycoprotease family protein n=1 Tax=Polyplosphaeria fusca TaxID=682080 RepID=A0A9P4R4L2_9PLEO|nr:hypothetical protein EJ04DRAFT_484747 [Polyplosphaeria fusca]
MHQNSGAGDQYVPVYFNGAYTLPQTTYREESLVTDAQIAARKAMGRRSSRSYAVRVARARSRKKETFSRPAKPGITLDTSFARHRGNVPRQLYPQDNDFRINGASKKHTWFGLGRANTKVKGLGITKGTPQPDRQGTEPAPPAITTYKDPKTADSLTPGTKPWLEISPSDRPIPIGISVPSDSIADFSPYQSTRQRSESDATLVTPSIIITPAEAMKSVWSPDTESDYTPARSSSIYSRATFNFHSTVSDAPPVPALPSNLFNPAGNANSNTTHNVNASASHARNDTLDSAGTAFEEDDEIKRKDRVMSSSTLFEDDETPLRDEPNLSLDTTASSITRGSHGWWNVITTPFEFSRANSVWTQNGRNAERTPDVPVIPQKSPSVHGNSPLVTIVHAAEVHAAASESGSIDQTSTKSPPMDRRQDMANIETQPKQRDTPDQTRQAPSSMDRNVSSPLSAMSASPVIGTAAMGTVLMPRQVSEDSRPININIELQDRRPPVNLTDVRANSPSIVATAQTSSPHPQHVNVNLPPSRGNNTRGFPLRFDPPPTVAQKTSHFSYDADTRASSPTSTVLKDSKDPKKLKKRNKVKNLMEMLPFLRKNEKGKTQDKKKKSRSRRWCCICCCCLIFLILLAVVIPVTVVLTRRHNNGPKAQDPPSEAPPSQWLNLTGYPPIPTGVSTIAQPEAVEEESGCIQPATSWSCALPKEQQQSISPNKPDQPNFKLEITFQNGTVSDPSKTRPAKRAPNPVSAGSLIRSRFLNLRAAPSASPAPPSLDDMKFLGETTDGVSSPFEGEETPFFFSLQDTSTATTSRLVRRAGDDSNNLTSVIPPPTLNSDGTAAPANLYPLSINQPLRLFNRGKADEHYGFYTYFDRSIFLKSITENATRGGNPADIDGGSPFDAATLRCTWAQTRFLVQIWTNSQTTKPLLNGAGSNSSANTFKRPGSFPYPVTVTIDRHGGTATSKMAYCYDMEKDGSIKNDNSKRFFLLEDRSFGGNLVNPSRGPVQNVSGPIDGGSGGCHCQWQNWLA